MLRPTLSKVPRTVLVGVRYVHALPSVNEPFADLFFYSREDGKRIWERRAPLTPDAVNKLVSTGKVVVEVESCSKRVFTDAEFEKVC